MSLALIIFAAVAALSHFLAPARPALAGACAGTGFAGWSVWLLWPWREAEFKSAMKRMAAGFLLRLALVSAIAAWGFATQMASGLAGIVAFGLTFLALTWLEHSKILTR